MIRFFSDKAMRDRYLWVVFPLMFLFVASANGALVYFAMTSWPGLAYENASERGRKFNRVLAEEEKESALGWKLDLRYSEGAVIVDARDRDGQVLVDLAVSGTLVRPLGGTDDRKLEFRPVGPGRYEAAAELPLKGQWEVRLVADRMGERSHSAMRFVVR
jgi:nitrogen fixation protein FixH